MLFLGCSTTDVASAFNFEHYPILIVVMIGLNSEANISFQSHYFSIQISFYLLNFICIISQNLVSHLSLQHFSSFVFFFFQLSIFTPCYSRPRWPTILWLWWKREDSLRDRKGSISDPTGNPLIKWGISSWDNNIMTNERWGPAAFLKKIN